MSTVEKKFFFTTEIKQRLNSYPKGIKLINTSHFVHKCLLIWFHQYSIFTETLSLMCDFTLLFKNFMEEYCEHPNQWPLMSKKKLLTSAIALTMINHG